ncbi:DUF1217 domain-containing protein [Limimaricola sp.]|uniref:DUF1217 domain-containing protein n=1 Tax=Limimaricola sp. TaxID=2211665 RepID=UPI003428BA11
MDSQIAAFERTPVIASDTAYFRANIGKVTSAADLVADRRLLGVALGAFGLDADIGSKAFIRQVLEGGTTDRGALANKLADKRYLALARSFGFGDLPVPRTVLSTFPDEILTKYRDAGFQAEVGQQDDTLRLALNLGPALGDVIAQNKGADAQWFAVMGNPPLRQVFEGALGLPASFGKLDIDRQITQFKARAQATFGTSTVADLADPAQQDKMIRLFLVRSEANATTIATGASIALSLLGG